MMHETVHTPAAVHQWITFLRTMEQRYARVAAARGEPFSPLSDDECAAAAWLATHVGVLPGDALTVLRSEPSSEAAGAAGFCKA